MTPLIASELLKLTTTRVWIGVGAAALAITALATVGRWRRA